MTEVTKQMITDWRERALRGEDLTEEEIRQGLEALRASRTAAAITPKAAKTKKKELSDGELDQLFIGAGE